MNALACIGGALVPPPLPRLDPMANEDQPGYMPTVEVIRIIKERYHVQFVKRVAKRCGYGQFTGAIHALDNAMALEIACREILDANRWILAQ